jgi:8-oxo-dGTP pyrophosphatase MutT (NUDIX family)
LLDQLQLYLQRHPGERERVLQMLDFVEAQPKCFLRSCTPGHVTGSAWIVSADHEDFLLVHHKKLGRWLQVGGHADGEPEVFRAALREAREESGLWHLEFYRAAEGIRPLDVDVHDIPAVGGEPAHLHYDMRFLLVARAGERTRPSGESHDVRWFPMRELERVVKEESLLRMGRKARDVLAVR